MPVRRGPAAPVAGLLALLLAAGCTTAEEPERRAGPSASVTPLADLDASATVLGRQSFCGSLPPGAPGRAIRAEVDEVMEYDSGDRVEVVDGVRDVAHEYSCEYRAEDGTAARAWVFAPAVTRSQARALAGEARAAGCRVPAETVEFGSPSVGLVCRDGERVTASYRGLFGDTWLACQLSGPRGGTEDLLSRTEEWCAAVVAAASA